MGRKGESPACTHVYLYIGGGKGLEEEEMGGENKSCDLDLRCLGSNKWSHLSAGRNETRRQQVRCRVSGFTPRTDPLAMTLGSNPSITWWRWCCCGCSPPPVRRKVLGDQGSGAALFWKLCGSGCIPPEGAAAHDPTKVFTPTAGQLFTPADIWFYFSFLFNYFVYFTFALFL